MQDQQLASLVEELSGLFEKDGEDLKAYLTALKHQKYLNYWDYINLESLLSLQQPRSNEPDELVFITYHQVTELYFKLILSELRQISNHAEPDLSFWETRLHRLINYFRILTQSFSVMKDGMDAGQFTRFRSALVPASGFQSVQYRMIELACTPLANLIESHQYPAVKNEPLSVQFEAIYWKKGAIDETTGEKTLTLRRFEEEYQDFLVEFARDWQGITLWDRYQNMSKTIRANKGLIQQMRQLDKAINVQWPKAHYNTAKQYLEHGPRGTGGTNYHSYLPPSHQKRIFFPSLWTAEEKANWGETAHVEGAG